MLSIWKHLSWDRLRWKFYRMTINCHVLSLTLFIDHTTTAMDPDFYQSTIWQICATSEYVLRIDFFIIMQISFQFDSTNNILYTHINSIKFTYFCSSLGNNNSTFFLCGTISVDLDISLCYHSLSLFSRSTLLRSEDLL